MFEIPVGDEQYGQNETTLADVQESIEQLNNYGSDRDPIATVQAHLGEYANLLEEVEHAQYVIEVLDERGEEISDAKDALMDWFTDAQLNVMRRALSLFVTAKEI